MVDWDKLQTVIDAADGVSRQEWESLLVESAQLDEATAALAAEHLALVEPDAV